MKTKHFYCILFALLLMSFVSQAQNIYFYFPGATTGKGPAGHLDEVSILAFSGGISKIVGSNPQLSDYNMSKDYDGSSIGLMTYTTNGNISPVAEIKFYSNVGGTETLVLKIELKNARIQSYQASGVPCASCPILTENISVSYDAVRIGTFMWDLITNTPTF